MLCFKDDNVVLALSEIIFVLQVALNVMNNIFNVHNLRKNAVTIIALVYYKK